MRPDDVVRVRHMVEAAEATQRFIAGRHRDDLDADQMLVFALLRAIEIIGEAAARMSPEGRNAAPMVPWSDIIAMRNRLIHAYFDINLTIVWKTVTEDIPPLVAQLRSLLSQGHGGP